MSLCDPLCDRILIAGGVHVTGERPGRIRFIWTATVAFVIRFRPRFVAGALERPEGPDDGDDDSEHDETWDVERALEHQGSDDKGDRDLDDQTSKASTEVGQLA